MPLRWLQITILLIAAVVIHDAWMAATGHDLAVTAAAAQAAPGHSHHHTGAEAHDGHTTPVELPDLCDTSREVAPNNQQLAPALDDGPVGAIPDTSRLELFASTSRTLVETPPVHPPDALRAFFQVFRI
jgi:hypothetical protein